MFIAFKILAIQEVSPPKCSCCEVHRNSIQQLLQQLLRKVTLLELNQNEIKSSIEKSYSDNTGSESTDFLIQFNMPFTSMDNFTNFESFLEDGDNMKKTVRFPLIYLSKFTNYTHCSRSIR